jgi:DNA-binding GntR family transcriptional regulator
LIGLPALDAHIREHVEFLRAIASGDADRAEALARDHVRGFERAIRVVV